MAKSKRTLAGIFVCIIAFAIISSVFYISINSSHHCVGEGCAICAQVATAEDTLKKFLSAGAATGVAAAILFCIAVISVPFHGNISESTLVTQKVKLLN